MTGHSIIVQSVSNQCQDINYYNNYYSSLNILMYIVSTHNNSCFEELYVES